MGVRPRGYNDMPYETAYGFKDYFKRNMNDERMRAEAGDLEKYIRQRMGKFGETMG